jgi:hypothetical protein
VSSIATQNLRPITGTEQYVAVNKKYTLENKVMYVNEETIIKAKQTPSDNVSFHKVKRKVDPGHLHMERGREGANRPPLLSCNALPTLGISEWTIPGEQ